MIEEDPDDEIPPDPFPEDGLAPLTPGELERIWARKVSGDGAMPLSPRDWVRLTRALKGGPRDTLT